MKTALDALQASVRSSRDTASKLPPHECESATTQAIGGTFTASVHFLRYHQPNARVSKLADMIWDIVGNRIVVVSATNTVDEISFLVLQKSAARDVLATILVPERWLDAVVDRPAEQMGGVVFVGSQAVDFYNGKIDGTNQARGEVVARSLAYEADFILTAQKELPALVLTQGQKTALKRYPEGLATASVAPQLYTHKPVPAQTIRGQA